MMGRNMFFVSSMLLLLAPHPPLFLASPENNTTDAGTQLGEHARIRALLERLNKPYLKTIEELLFHLLYLFFDFFFVTTWLSSLCLVQSPDGDTIDCVLSHLQPAFDHPKLRGLKPLEPPELPKHYGNHSAMDNITQPWRTTGETCPEGTVPIRRTKEEEVRRVERFGRKPMARVPPAVDLRNHEHSYARVKGDLYFGAEAIFNLWKPEVENSNEFSLSQLWVISGTRGAADENTIEVGWQVFPRLYGDASPRLFVYWTRDSYQKTGCYNIGCGFVQVSNELAVGAALTPTSTYDGNQYEFTFTVWMDQATRNWWLRVGSITVGYWPKTLFTNIDGGATIVEYGGEIINTNPSGHHTATQMGSGHFADEGFRKAAYIRNLALVNKQNTLYPVNDVTFNAETPSCYSIQGSKTSNWGTYFFFGGPGKNSNCP